MTNSNVVQGVADHSVTVINAAVCEAATKAVRADATSASRWASFHDLAVETGLKAEHFKSPNNKNNPISADDPVILKDIGTGERVTTTAGELYADIVNLAYSFLPAADRRLLDTPTAGLSDDKKEAKRYASQQRGSYISKMGKQLAKKEGGDKAPSRNKSVAVRIAENLISAKKWAQADEEPNYDHAELIRCLDRAMRAIHDALPQDVTDSE